RRSRGFAPNPVYLNFDADGILATGAELKNTFCMGKGNQALISQHIGDLKDFETFSFYEKNIEQFKKMFRTVPKLIVTDLHPEYLSTRYALESGLPVVQVQHHHAHIASAMVENSLVDEKVIGVSFDGTGLGDDGNIWGSEFFVCNLESYERMLHYLYVPLPGGDKATKEPWRITVSWLYKVFGMEFLELNLPFLQKIPEEKIEWVVKSIENQINCPLSSGSGRLFDAVSSLLGLCNVSTFEAEAPMRLENIIEQNEEYYSYKLSQVIDFSEMFAEIITDLDNGLGAGRISAKFHNTISQSIIEGVKRINKETGISKVVLSGGTFQNRYLTERTETKLNELGFNVFGNCAIPCNDGGISLGQLAIAAKRRSLIL
ncbi:MAG: hypothetical protein R3182_09020, partial [Draconibacterium sp.]|nr:hypothetical protein [Draconibacterium sp.]